MELNPFVSHSKKLKKIGKGLRSSEPSDYLEISVEGAGLEPGTFWPRKTKGTSIRAKLVWITRLGKESLVLLISNLGGKRPFL